MKSQYIEEEYTDELGEVENGTPDTRPEWAKKLQGYHHDWSQIDRIEKTCQKAGVELTTESVVALKTIALQMERCYLTTVFVDSKEVGKYSY